MQIDIEDILAGTFGRILRQCLLFASAVWVGSMVGGLALVAGICVISWDDGMMQLPLVWASPVLLGSQWLVLNAVVLLGGLGYFLISEDAGFAGWGILAGLQSLFVVLGWSMDLEISRSIVVCWISWLVLLVMMEAGVLLIWQMLRNRWARQLALLEIENAHRRAEFEARQREGIRREMEADQSSSEPTPESDDRSQFPRHP